VYFAELSPSEIAERLGVPPERIRQRKHRALARLRLAFEESMSLARSRHTDAVGPTKKITIAATLESLRSSE
jgi:hypothetical protein